jgi:hypothetical protein
VGAKEEKAMKAASLLPLSWVGLEFARLLALKLDFKMRLVGGILPHDKHSYRGRPIRRVSIGQNLLEQNLRTITDLESELGNAVNSFAARVVEIPSLFCFVLPVPSEADCHFCQIVSDRAIGLSIRFIQAYEMFPRPEHFASRFDIAVA